MQNFDDDVKYDQSYHLPFILDAVKSNPNLLLFGSPWSPPAWMKTNNNMLSGGSLLSSYQSSWANYFSKWITAYENKGIKIWGVTVQNEPEVELVVYIYHFFWIKIIKYITYSFKFFRQLNHGNLVYIQVKVPEIL